MKLTKILLALLLTLVLVCTGLPFAFAEDASIVDSGTCGDNLTWTLDSAGTLTISGNGNMYDYWEGYDDIAHIYRTNAPWGKYYQTIQAVVLEDGVTSIGWSAFVNCTALQSVTIGDSVTSIGERVFYNCAALTSVTIGNSLQSIGSFAFACCDSLETVAISNSSPTIGEGAFFGCSLITAFPTDLSGTCGENLTWTLDSEGTLKINGSGNMTNYNSADGPSPLWKLVKDSIRKVYIGYGVTSIGDEAFLYCNSLESITIPDSVTRIGVSAFYDCCSLQSVMITDLAAWCIISFSDMHANPLSFGGDLYLNGEILETIDVPEGVSTINNRAFYNYTALQSVTIPDSVTSIGWSAFENCTSLTSVTIPDSVTSISNSAFRNCRSLSKVYYAGSEQQWNRIEINSDNVYLRSANIIYNYCTHENTIETEGVDSTCTSVGYSAGIYCNDCGTYISGHEEIVPLSHAFAPWSRFVMADDAAYAVEIRFCNTCGYYELRQADPATPTDPTDPTNPTDPTDPTEPANEPTTEPATQPSGENEQNEEPQGFFAKIGAFFRNLFDRIFSIFRR